MRSGSSSEKASGEIDRYLAEMDALGAELERAMEAIGANALPALEQSVRRQREQAAALALTAAQANRLACKPLLSRGQSSRAARAEEQLWALNARYAALLAHSGRTVRMLQSLYLPAGVLASKAAQPGARQHSWEG